MEGRECRSTGVHCGCSGVYDIGTILKTKMWIDVKSRFENEPNVPDEFAVFIPRFLLPEARR
jgi:hypothetical protein